MVNSPSWPNLRLLAPPALVDCGGMTPLWHRETCLPVHRPPVPNQTKSDHAHPLPARCSRGGFPDLRNPESVSHFPPIKAKNPAIVPHQGISRHPMKKHKMAMPHQSGWNRRNAGTVSPSPGGEGRGEGGQQNKLASVRRCMGLSPETRFPSQSRLIKANKASSMQTMKFSNGEVGRVRCGEPKRPRWQASSRSIRDFWLAGGGGQRTALPTAHSPFATLRLRAFALKPRHQGSIKAQSRQKPQQSCLIKPHQGKK